MNPKELREKRAQVAVRMKELAEQANASDHVWSAEDEANWSAVNADYDKLTAQIERAERAESVAAEQVVVAEAREREEHDNRGTGAVTEEDRAQALTGWMRAQCGLDIEDRQRDALNRLGISPNQRHYDIRLADTPKWREMRTVNYTSTASGYGGTTIPAGFVNSFETSMLAWGGILRVADVIRTDSGNALTWPTADDTSNTGELIGEVTTDSSSAVSNQNIATSSLTLNAYNYSSKLVRVSVSLLQDSAFDMPAWLGEALGTRIGRKTNLDMTTGDGSSKPNGIVTAAGTGATSSSATAIDEDDIINLIHAVDPAYRNQPGAGFMFHDSILAAVRKIKDTNGQFLWADALKGGVPATLAGYPYTINQDMCATITAADITMLFGALNKYKVRQVREIRLRRLVERYAEYDQEGFVAFLRCDGDLLDAGTDPVVKLTQTGGGS